jgi:hypothetical protein
VTTLSAYLRAVANRNSVCEQFNKGEDPEMKNLTLVLAFLLAASDATTVLAQNPKYPPLSEYMMTPEAEISLARSAAPDSVSAHATVKILAASGYKIAAQGDNGFVCLVMRAWSAPTYTPAQFRDLVYDAGVRAPICFNPPAAKEVLPYYELRSKLGMEGKTPDQIRESVEAPIPGANFRGGMKSRSRICGQRIRTWVLVLVIGIRT